MAYDFSSVKILVVEDNKPMLRLMQSLLQSFGVKDIVCAADGAVGFDLFCRGGIDLVVADWMMKPVDGITLAQRIRNEAHGLNAFVPIILMTGFSDQRRVFEARDAGVTEFLVKPFSARDLYKRIVQVIERPRQFVRSEDFFGPDRRRKDAKDYTGFERRGGGQDSLSRQAEERLKYSEVLRKAHPDEVINVKKSKT